MTAAPNTKQRRVPALVWLLIPMAAAVLFIGANAHMLYVAIKSQPECVAHLKGTGSAGQFMAAKPAC
jgi:hypothetical protein